MQATTLGLTHLALYVKDLEQTLAFYQHVFEVGVVYRDETTVQVQTPDSMDNIAFELNAEKAGSAGGVVHFGFRATSPEHVMTLAERAEQSGGSVLRSGEFAPGLPYAYVSDPNGYEIEIWFE